jgi:hypothetical protein
MANSPIPSPLSIFVSANIDIWLITTFYAPANRHRPQNTNDLKLTIIQNNYLMTILVKMYHKYKRVL